MIVLDASAAIDFLARTGQHERIAGLIERPGETLHAPHVIDIEVLSGLRKLERLGRVTRERNAEALEDFDELAIERYPHRGLLARIWELRHNLTVTDAAYVALAEVLEAPLVTADSRIARAPGHHAVVEVMG